MKYFLLSLLLVLSVCLKLNGQKSLQKSNANKCCKNVAPIFTSVNKTRIEKATQTISFVEEYTSVCNTTTIITHSNSTSTQRGDILTDISNIITSVGNIITTVVCDILSASCNNNNNNNNVIITTNQTIQTNCTKTRVAFK